MRSSTLYTRLRRFLLLSALVGLLGFLGAPAATASIAILQEPFPESLMPAPDPDEDEEPLPEPDVPDIDIPDPGPGDDTPDPGPERPVYPFDDLIVDYLVPGVIEIVQDDDDTDDGGRPGFDWTVQEGELDWGILLERPRPDRNPDQNRPNHDCDRDDCDRDDPNHHDDNDTTHDDGKDDGGKDDDGKDDGDTNDGEGESGDGDGKNGNSSRLEFDGGLLRWQTVDVQQGPQGLRWLARAELRWYVPELDTDQSARFLLRAQIVDGTTTFQVDNVRLRREFQRGDVSGDQTLGMNDGIQILERLFGRSDDGAPFCESAADANDDGDVDISDVMAIFDHLYLGGKPLAAPFDTPGHESTLDDLQCPVGYTATDDLWQ